MTENFNHAIESWSHVLGGKSTLSEKLEVGVEAALLVAAAAAASRLHLSGALNTTLKSALKAESVTLPELKIGGDMFNFADLRAKSPHVEPATDLAERLKTALNNKGGNLYDNLAAATNDFRAKHFSHVPPVSHLGAEPFGPVPCYARRNTVFWCGEFMKNAEGAKAFRTGSGQEIIDEAEIVFTGAHEFKHIEQEATCIWRQADLLGIDKQSTSEQMKELLRLHAGDHEEDLAQANYLNHPDTRYLSIKKFIEHVIEMRDGRFLSASEARRADGLEKSLAKTDAAQTRALNLIENASQTQMFVEQFNPVTVDDYSALYRHVESAPIDSIPKGLRNYVNRAKEMHQQSSDLQAIPDWQKGQSYFQAFTNHAEALSSQSELLGLRPYRNLLHEREANEMGSAVEAAFNELTKGQ